MKAAYPLRVSRRVRCERGVHRSRRPTSPSSPGPSEFALSLAAHRDARLASAQDGASQSSIAVVARAMPTARAMPACRCACETAVNGARAGLRDPVGPHHRDGHRRPSRGGIHGARHRPRRSAAARNLVTILRHADRLQLPDGEYRSVGRNSPRAARRRAAARECAHCRSSPCRRRRSRRASRRTSTRRAAAPRQSSCSSTAGITSFSWNFGDGTSGSRTGDHAYVRRSRHATW